MDSAEWRPYRGHLIIARPHGLFGRRRWELWRGDALVGLFRSVVAAELHVDAHRGAVSPPARP